MNNGNRKLMYSLRNATIIFNNTFEETKCNFGCETKNEVKHLFSCKYLNKEEKNYNDEEEFYNGSFDRQFKIFCRLKENVSKINGLIKFIEIH